MKKNKITILLFLILLSSCTNNLEGLNTDVKNATSAPASAFFNVAVKNMSDLQNGITYGADGNPFNTTRILVQQISSVTYNEGATYYSSFNWDNMYADVLVNLAQSAKVVKNDPLPSDGSGETTKQNKLAQIEIMTVYSYAKLVESFGDIPYSEALDVDNITPKYDDAETIYIDLIKRLSSAINNLNSAEIGFEDDLIYDGDVSKWIKFGNSLKLQMGMRIIETNHELGSETVIASISRIFESNGDNATVEHLSSPPNTNELWTDLALGNRRDFVGGEPFINLMNELNDPRRQVFFTTVDNKFVGSQPGAVVNYDDYSLFGEIFYQPTTPVIFLDYASVEFFLSEAAERGIGSIMGAEAHYNKAIRASFEYYDVEGVEVYLQQAKVAYPTAAGSWKQKIGEQKWIHLFNQGLEAWTEYRRLDYPELSAPPGAFIDIVPVRLTYPIDEQNLNQVNYEDAATAIGGDLMTTKLFWDIN